MLKRCHEGEFKINMTSFRLGRANKNIAIDAPVGTVGAHIEAGCLPVKETGLEPLSPLQSVEETNPVLILDFLPLENKFEKINTCR